MGGGRGGGGRRLGGEELSDGLISQENTYGPIVQTHPLYQSPCDVSTVPTQCSNCAESCRSYFYQGAVTNFSLSAIISYQSRR